MKFITYPRGLDSSNKELGAVGIGSSIRHTEVKGPFMLELKVLISKLFAVNTFSATSVAVSKVSSLKHKVGNHTVKDGVLVMKRLSCLSYTLFTCAESTKVLGGLGHGITEQTKDDASTFTSVDGNVEENFICNRWAVTVV